LQRKKAKKGRVKRKKSILLSCGGDNRGGKNMTKMVTGKGAVLKSKGKGEG